MKYIQCILIIILILAFSTEIGACKTLEQYRRIDGELVRIEREAISNRPEPGIPRIIYPEKIVKGEEGYIGIGVNNSGTNAPIAYVVVSISNGFKLINYSDTPSLVYPGEEIIDINLNPIKAKYRILNWSTNFTTGENKVFAFNFTIRDLEDQWFTVRVLFRGEGGVWSGKKIYPTEEMINTEDQQKFPAFRKNIKVIRLGKPAITLSAVPVNKFGQKSEILLIFKNSGDKTLLNPVYYYDGKVLKNAWNLAPGASMTFNIKLDNYSSGDLITKTAGISGCFEPCGVGFYSKKFTVEYYVLGEEVAAIVMDMENETARITPTPAPEPQGFIEGGFKVPKEVITVQPRFGEEDSFFLKSVVDAISDFFRRILS
jgi:hypothetical protein